MDVVGHEYVGVNVTAVCAASQLEFFKVEPVIRVSAKYLAAIIAAHN